MSTAHRRVRARTGDVDVGGDGDDDAGGDRQEREAGREGREGARGEGDGDGEGGEGDGEGGEGEGEGERKRRRVVAPATAPAPGLAHGGPSDAAPARWTFAHMLLKAPVLRALTEAGYTAPSPVQRQVIPLGKLGVGTRSPPPASTCVQGLIRRVTLARPRVE